MDRVINEVMKTAEQLIKEHPYIDAFTSSAQGHESLVFIIQKAQREAIDEIACRYKEKVLSRLFKDGNFKLYAQGKESIHQIEHELKKELGL